MRCFIITVILIIIKALIANFVDNDIIRIYLGDIIWVFFLYYLCRCFIRENMLLPVGVLILAIIIEIGQMYGIGEMIIDKTGTNNTAVNGFIRTMTGLAFDIEDIICYIVATIFIYLGLAVKKMLGRG